MVVSGCQMVLHVDRKVALEETDKNGVVSVGSRANISFMRWDGRRSPRGGRSRRAKHCCQQVLA